MTQLTRVRDEEMVRLALANGENGTGFLDYNKYGMTDGVGFISCSEMFVDNFVFGCYVPDYLIENSKYKEVGLTNKLIRQLLTKGGLVKCHVKGIGLRRTFDPVDPATAVTRCLSLEKPTTKYFIQEYKIACPDKDYNDVMAFLRLGAYKACGIFLRDVDVTMDYSGSFKKKELEEYMLKDERFRLQGTEDVANCTILTNEKEVGLNCLTWVETENDMTVRSKIYNKMVQMLESQAVRAKVGNHWKGWVDQLGTRLAESRRKAKDRGLTRTEVTFYCVKGIPSDHYLKEKLLYVAKLFPNDLVYATPYNLTWQAYCETFVHSLVVIDKIVEKGSAIIVHSVNEVTGKISGKKVQNWRQCEQWCLANLTLSEKLPLDIIEIDAPGKSTDEKLKYRVKMDTYIKENTRGIPFTTRLIGHGVYNKSGHSNQESWSNELLHDAGVLPHESCIPLLPWNEASRNHKSYLRLHHIEQVEPKGIPKKRKPKKKTVKTEDNAVELKETCDPQGRADKMQTVKEDVLERRRNKLREETLFKSYSKAKRGKLAMLDLGSYKVVAMKPCMQKYGEKFVLLLDVGGELLPCYSTLEIEEYVCQNLPKERRLELQRHNVIYLDEEAIATLTILGKKKDKKGRPKACCQFSLSKPMKEFAGIEDKNEEEATPPQKEVIKAAGMPSTILYRDLPNLTTLPKGSSHTVSAIGHTVYYGSKMVVMLGDGKHYQAGENLSDQADKLTSGCKITIEKHRTNRTNRKRYAVCKIIETGREDGQQEKDGVQATRYISEGHTVGKRKREITLDTEINEVKKQKL